MSKPRVLIADDHTLVVEAFETLLAPACDVIGHVADGRAMVAAARTHRPDVIVVDVGMPLLNGLDAGRQVKQFDASIRLVFVTMNEDADLAAEAFRAGASAYLLKRSASSELLDAIREVMKRRSYLTPLVAAGVVQSLMHGPNAGKPAHELTMRQREVLQLLAEGKSMKEAASILRVAARTVAFHKYRMMEQLQITSSGALIRFAVERHLV
jgi:DNA-binding NarL/FixJ family response regulator